MKENTSLLVRLFVLLLLFYACNDVAEEITAKALEDITISATDFNIEDVSRSTFNVTNAGAEFVWTENDTVGIFPDNGAQVYFPMVSGAGSKQANFTGGGWALKSASTYAAYYPFVGDFYLNKNAIPVNYTGQEQIGNASIAHIGAYDYMAASTSTPSNGKVNFQFQHLGALIQLRLLLPQPTTLNSITLTTEANSFAVKGTVDIMAEELAITAATSDNKLTLDLKDISTTENSQIVTLYMMIPPTDLSGKTLKAVVKKALGSEEVVLPAKNFEAGKAYALSGSLKDNSGSSNGNGTYQNGVVSLATAGTMKQLLGSDYLEITSLKVVGPINGDDIYYLRKMLGGSNFSQADWGKLETLDLSDARIVEGGEWYYDTDAFSGGIIITSSRTTSRQSDSKRYTTNNTIGDYMFYCCTNLQKIILPNNVMTIGKLALSECKSLSTVTLGNNTNSIGEYAFRGSALSFIDIPNSVSDIGGCAFEGCEFLTTLSINGNGSTKIGLQAFGGCKTLKQAEIGDGVISLGYGTFAGCYKLERVTIGNGVSIIPAKIFENCRNLKYITFGNGIKEFKGNVFGYAPKDIFLKAVYIHDLAAWCELVCDDPYSFPFLQGYPDLYVNNELVTELTIPQEVTKVGNMFRGCKSIKKVILSEGVISVGDFSECKSLTNIKISSTVTSLGSFNDCPLLEKIDIPHSVKSIGTFSNCKSLTEAKLGDGITSIPDRMFYGCISLEKVTIGNNVEKIGEKSFAETGIKEFYCYSKNPPQLTHGGSSGMTYYNSFASFPEISNEAKLYVPSRCGAEYYKSGWGSFIDGYSDYFMNIIEMD